MRRILLGLALVLLATSAHAQGGGSPGNPMFVAVAQGTQRDQYSITCSAAGNTQLLTAAQTANALSIYVQNLDATKAVGICPRSATAGACDSAAKFAARLAAGAGWTTNVSSPGDWSCNGIGANVVVAVYVERFVKQSTTAGPNPTPGSPTPTAIPTQTAGPTPTP